MLLQPSDNSLDYDWLSILDANLFNNRDTEFPTLHHIDAIINLKRKHTSASF